MIKFLSKKFVIIAVIIIIIGGFVVYKFFIQENGPEYELVKILRSTVIREVSETGTVKISEETNLSFENGGRIEKIYVKVGDKIVSGQALAKLDTSQLSIELLEAQASLEVAQADYNKLLAGSSPEEIKIAETEVLNAKITLDNTRQSLKDIEADAAEGLKNYYENALNTLDDAYLKIYNAYTTVDSVQRTYFTSSDQEGFTVREKKTIIENAKDNAEFYINEAKNGSRDEIDAALSEVKKSLEKVRDTLEIIRNMAETPIYRNTVSSSDKTSLDNQKLYIITALTNIVDDQQTISSTKITNASNINTAKAEVASAEAKLQKAEDELALKKAGPTQENIDLYQAKIRQAQAKVSLLQNQIQEATLKGPSEGQITKIEKREGEVAQPTDAVISFLPAGPFQIEADIYEEDIVNVKVGNPVKIILAAFPDDTLMGKVVLIDPAEKLIEGVVYYEITISFQETKEGIKPGMTADIVIEVGRKDNVLVVSKRAIKKKDGKKTVQIFQNNKIEEREIETGLVGDDLVEVVSGLSEGEEILTGNK